MYYKICQNSKSLLLLQRLLRYKNSRFSIKKLECIDTYIGSILSVQEVTQEVDMWHTSVYHTDPYQSQFLVRVGT